MLFKVSKSGEVTEVSVSNLVNQELFESDVEAWVERRPEILGEPLLIIGRQVPMDDGKDRLDLLALDQNANLVVIELKRDLIGGSADLQALRYAAMVSTWPHETIRTQAEGYWKSAGQKHGTFAQAVADFCGEDYELNVEQRLILAGRDVKPRLGTMVTWLRRHQIDARVVSIGLLEDNAQLYLQPQTVIPVPSEERFQRPVTVGSADKPWLVDGQSWHLEQRCSPRGKEIVRALATLIGEAVPLADGPNWAQKYSIAWRFNSRIWTTVETLSPNQATLSVRGLSASPEDIAASLGFSLFHSEAGLSEKLALGSSVGGVKPGELRFIIKSAGDVAGGKAQALAGILRQAWTGFTGQELPESAGVEPEAAGVVAGGNGSGGAPAALASL